MKIYQCNYNYNDNDNDYYDLIIIQNFIEKLIVIDRIILQIFIIIIIIKIDTI